MRVNKSHWCCRKETQTTVCRLIRRDGEGELEAWEEVPGTRQVARVPAHSPLYLSVRQAELP